MAWNPSKVSYTIPIFDGGLNSKYTDIHTPVNQAPELQNVAFNDFGACGTSEGYTTLNTSVASSGVDGLHSINFSNTEYLLMVASGTCWETDSATFVTVASSQDVYTSGVDVGFVTVQDEAWLTNGNVKVYRYDGTSFVQAGVATLASGTGSAVSAGLGDLNGEYTWAIAGLNGNAVEGTRIPITSAAVTIVSGDVTLTDIPEWPTSAGVATKYLYRNTAGAAGIYYRVTALSNSVSSYTDTAADSAISTSAQTDNGIPPQCPYMIYHRGRVFAAGDSDNAERLYYSNQGAPEVWPATNYQEIGDGDGLPITGLRAMGNSIIVHKGNGKEYAVWLVYMPDSVGVTDATNWYIIKSPAAYSGESHKAMAFFDNLLLYLNRTGVYAFTGEDLAPGPAQSSVGTYAVESRSDDIEPDIRAINTSYIDKAAAIDYDNRVWFAVPYGSATANSRLYTFDYVRPTGAKGQGAWAYMTGPAVNNFAVYGGDLVGGSTTEGIVYKLDRDSVYNADGSAIDSWFKTVHISGKKEHAEHTKVWRYLYVVCDTPGDWPMSVTYYLDKSDTAGNTINVSLNPGGSLWGSATLGTDKWGGGTSRKTVRVGLGSQAVSKTIQFQFRTNTADQHFAVHRIELVYNLRSRRD